MVPALGAVAAGVLIVASTRNAGVPSAAPVLQSNVTARPPVASVPAPQPVPIVSSALPSLPRTPRANGPSAEELAWQERALPALAIPEALTMKSIQPEALEIRPLITTPLTIAALEDSDDEG